MSPSLTYSRTPCSPDSTTPHNPETRDQATAYLAAGQPVISVDAQKKELVGQFANTGVEWQPSGEPERVNVHDFPDPELGKAIPTASRTWGAIPAG
jgi:hypothetical protein